MALDFTALNNIPLRGAKKESCRPLPAKQELSTIQGITVEIEGSLAREPAPATGRAFYLLDRERQERENNRQMYARYQQNIKRAGTLRSDIVKGIQAGEDPAILLLKAVECISLMTGDTAIYSQSKEDLLGVYGRGLHNPEVLRLELEEAQSRLALLTKQAQSDTTQAQRSASRDTAETATMQATQEQRTQRAIEAHRRLIEALERELAGEA